MKEDQARSVQLLLTVPVMTLGEMSQETQHLLIAALADLLLDAAIHGVPAMEGGSDEREDP